MPWLLCQACTSCTHVLTVAGFDAPLTDQESPGNDISFNYVNSVQECADICSGLSNCVAFGYIASGPSAPSQPLCIPKYALRDSFQPFGSDDVGALYIKSAASVTSPQVACEGGTIRYSGWHRLCLPWPLGHHHLPTGWQSRCLHLHRWRFRLRHNQVHCGGALPRTAVVFCTCDQWGYGWRPMWWHLQVPRRHIYIPVDLRAILQFTSRVRASRFTCHLTTYVTFMCR